MSYKTGLLFSSIILSIIGIGILATIYFKKQKSSPTSAPSSSAIYKIQMQNTSQNFATDNSRRAEENLRTQMANYSSLSPYINSSNNNI
jgi:hypothetical protein